MWELKILNYYRHIAGSILKTLVMFFNKINFTSAYVLCRS